GGGRSRMGLGIGDWRLGMPLVSLSPYLLVSLSPRWSVVIGRWSVVGGLRSPGARRRIERRDLGLVERPAERPGVFAGLPGVFGAGDGQGAALDQPVQRDLSGGLVAVGRADPA